MNIKGTGLKKRTS